MNTSMSWIKMYVPDLDVTAQEYTDAMTLSGTKVEGFEKLDADLEKIVIGQIEKIEKHPDADKLIICQVNVGTETIQIVTGAPNVKEGDKVPVVLDGGRVAGGHDGKMTPGGIRIKKGKLRGIESNGMMCSIEEMGSSREMYPEAPEYGIRLMVGRYPFHSNEQPDNMMYLDLPATQERLDAVLEACGGAFWSEMVFRVEDSAMPALLENTDCNDIHGLNELAKCFKELSAQGELSKFKAVILAADCHDIAAAVQIEENLDDYLLEPDQRTPEEVAVEELRFIVDEHSRSILQKHVVLYNYGQDVMAAHNALLTPYGLIQRRDGEPIRSEETQAENAGMEMM